MITPQDTADQMIQLATTVAVLAEESPLILLMQIATSLAKGELCLSRSDDGEIGWCLQDGTPWTPANKLPA